MSSSRKASSAPGSATRGKRAPRAPVESYALKASRFYFSSGANGTPQHQFVEVSVQSPDHRGPAEPGTNSLDDVDAGLQPARLPVADSQLDLLEIDVGEHLRQSAEITRRAGRHAFKDAARCSSATVAFPSSRSDSEMNSASPARSSPPQTLQDGDRRSCNASVAAPTTWCSWPTSSRATPTPSNAPRRAGPPASHTTPLARAASREWCPASWRLPPVPGGLTPFMNRLGRPMLPRSGRPRHGSLRSSNLVRSDKVAES
jgi:hypothetical protein